MPGLNFFKLILLAFGFNVKIFIPKELYKLISLFSTLEEKKYSPVDGLGKMAKGFIKRLFVELIGRDIFEIPVLVATQALL